MKKYKILKVGVDFNFNDNGLSETNTKGSRVKRIVIDKKNRQAYFKYEKYNCSEACSEKMSYEIAKILGYPCAHIELGKDEKGNLGVLNYLFINRIEEEHDDAVSYINKDASQRKDFYTIENIKKCLDAIDKNLFNDFLKIMVFDALVGETDRHEENWGITKSKKGYKISPLYDNGCNLVRNFKDEKLLQEYESGKKTFKDYINKPKSVIYKDDHSGQYKLVELIEFLYEKYPEQIKKELINLDKLTESKIEEIVNKISNDLLTELHKKYIIQFLKERKKILQGIIEKERK